jgi:hypothetical protein
VAPGDPWSKVLGSQSVAVVLIACQKKVVVPLQSTFKIIFSSNVSDLPNEKLKGDTQWSKK